MAVTLQTGAVLHKKKHYILKCNFEELVLIPADRQGVKALFINVADCYGVQASSANPCSFYLYALVAAADLKREHANYLFTCTTSDLALSWVDVLQHAVTATALDQPIVRRKVLLYVNPFGGTKKVLHVYPGILTKWNLSRDHNTDPNAGPLHHPYIIIYACLSLHYLTLPIGC